MNINFSKFFNKGERIAVALSGGSDSMALLNFLIENANAIGITILALNVEHGIRGESSVNDSNFVYEYCSNHNIPLLSYAVDSIKKAKDEKLSIEQSARMLRYECFYNAIKSGKCDKVATAHHLSDNAESVLFNLFRGTGLKGLTGINQNFSDCIVRPFLSVSKAEIDAYVNKNAIPYVTDQTNFCDKYSRNFLRLNVIPRIKEIFPDFENSILRFSEIAKADDDYLTKIANEHVELVNDFAKIKLPIDKAIFSRACIMAFNHLGIEKDWEKTHVDSAYSLAQKENGSMIDLPKNVVAIKEYDNLVFYKKEEKLDESMPFFIGTKQFYSNNITISILPNTNVDLKSGLFTDAKKIPSTATIRFKREGDAFTKFGGGTKSLGDYLTDKKIPLRLRDTLPVLADGTDILVIFGVAVSDKVKADDSTTELINFTIQKEKTYE